MMANIFKILEFLILGHLVYCDERDQEVWALELLSYVLLKGIWSYKSNDIHLHVVLFGSFLYLGIFLVSRGGFGFGDVLLNLGLSFSFRTVNTYFLYFTVTFVLGAIHSIFLMIFKDIDRKARLPFMKYQVIGYYFFVLLGEL